MPHSIDEFQGEYRFLSNFYPCAVMYDGYLYRSVEHAYQAAKTFDEQQRLKIRKLSKPGEAKRAGRRITLRKDWEEVKLDIMLELLEKKFQEPSLKRRLIATGNATLIEGNNWNDTFWGVCRDKGDNHLGRLLMQVRDRIRRES